MHILNNMVKLFRTHPHRKSARLFGKILPLTALKILEIPAYSCGFVPCHQQNLTKNMHTLPMWNGSYCLSN